MGVLEWVGSVTLSHPKMDSDGERMLSSFHYTRPDFLSLDIYFCSYLSGPLGISKTVNLY